MLDIFRGLKNLLKVNRIHIDGNVFRLHYNVTVTILIAFSVIVTTKQYVGNPIECLHSRDIPENVINTYCWIHSTFTILSAYSTNIHDPLPGIGSSDDRKDWKVHKYYQWVCFVLFFQAILCYIPRWLWKHWEGGKIMALTMDLKLGICREAEKKQQKKLLLDYLWINLGQHRFWAVRYFACEGLSFFNVIGQMFLMDRFFDGEFMTYGFKVIEFVNSDQEDRIDPMIFIFPRLTKCLFWKYGSSGSPEKHDSLCVLPLNEVNEKMYIFLWFWFVILGPLTALTLTFRIVVFTVPQFRLYFLYLRFRVIPKKQLRLLLDKTNMGDWFLFYMLGKNVDTLILRDVLMELSDKFLQSTSKDDPPAV